MNMRRNIMEKEIIEKQDLFSTIVKQTLLEMATFGRINADSKLYKIAIHGPATKDRDYPHIHIYLANDSTDNPTFNFEVSLIDLVCSDCIKLVSQLDREKNIHNTHKDDCTWEGYRDLYKSFKAFLFAKPMKTVYVNSAINNLQVAIMEWDNENNDNMEDNESLMKKYIESKGFTILPKYLPLFNYGN
jgi:hypothetical protein